MNPDELFDTFEEAVEYALRTGDDDEINLVYRIRDQDITQYGVCSENQFLATSHQWLRDSDIVYSTDQE